MSAAGCAICGRAASRRIDLTVSAAGGQTAGGYTVQAVLRGILLCTDHGANATLGGLLAQLGGGVVVVRGCLVQCSNQPPWWLQMVRPAVARAWNKVICPNCGGRASVQWLGDAVQPLPRLFDWLGGLRQAIEVLSWRRLQDLEEVSGDDNETDPGSGRPVPDRPSPGLDSDHRRSPLRSPAGPVGTADAELALVGEGDEGPDGSRPADTPVPRSTQAQVTTR